MPDPLAQRVAARFQNAASNPEALLHAIETAMHKGKEHLHAVNQHHAALEKAITGRGSLGEAARLFHQIQTAGSEYAKELQAAMAALDEYEHAQGNVD